MLGDGSPVIGGEIDVGGEFAVVIVSSPEGVHILVELKILSRNKCIRWSIRLCKYLLIELSLRDVP